MLVSRAASGCPPWSVMLAVATPISKEAIWEPNVRVKFIEKNGVPFVAPKKVHTTGTCNFANSKTRCWGPVRHPSQNRAHLGGGGGRLQPALMRQPPSYLSKLGRGGWGGSLGGSAGGCWGGWVGLGQGLAWSPTHGPRRLPCRTRLGGRTRVSGHKACRTVDRPQTPRWRSRAGDAAVPVCMCPCVSGGGGGCGTPACSIVVRPWRTWHGEVCAWCSRPRQGGWRA